MPQVTKKQTRKKALDCRTYQGMNFVPSATICIWHFMDCKLISFTLLIFASYVYIF